MIVGRVHWLGFRLWNVCLGFLCTCEEGLKSAIAFVRGHQSFLSVILLLPVVGLPLLLERRLLFLPFL